MDNWYNIVQNSKTEYTLRFYRINPDMNVISHTFKNTPHIHVSTYGRDYITLSCHDFFKFDMLDAIRQVMAEWKYVEVIETQAGYVPFHEYYEQRIFKSKNKLGYRIIALLYIISMIAIISYVIHTTPIVEVTTTFKTIAYAASGILVLIGVYIHEKLSE